MRKNLILYAPIFLLFSNCSSPPPPPPRPSQAELDVVQSDLANCLGRAAERMDDGKSDAATVGMAIAPLCTSEFYRLVALEGRGLNPAAYDLYLQKARPRELQISTGMVLRVRTLRAQQSPN